MKVQRNSFVAFGLFLECTSAIPFQQMMSQKTFTLEQTPVYRTVPRSGANAIRNDYRRYGVNVEIPAEVDEAPTKELVEGEGSVLAESSKKDLQYLINVQVGNYNLTMDLDTGSSDLWVVSTLLPANQTIGRNVSRIYNPATSKATQLPSHSWTIRYGDQSGANGDVYLDKVTIGGLTVPRQAVEAARNMSAMFTSDSASDGLLGLGFSASNTVKPNKQTTWFDNIRSNLSAPLFTASLKRRAAGSYDFGFIDKSKYTGEIVYANVTRFKDHWDFKSTGFTVGDGPIQPANITAIADTGSSLWYLPKPLVDTYWAQVQGAGFNRGAGGWVYPCASYLPDMSVVISGKKITVPGINMEFQSLQSGFCFGGIQQDLPNLPFSIFGDVFLKGLYVVHESPVQGQPRIGFAKGA